MDNLTPTRGYFSGPEGKVNATTWGALAVAALTIIWIMGGKIGEYIVAALTNTLDGMIHLGVIVGVLGVTGAAIIDPKKRVWYLFRMIVRLITTGEIRANPLSIKKIYFERLQAQYKKFTDSVANFRGQLVGMQRKALENHARLADQTAKYGAAVTTKDHDAQVLSSRNMQRLGDLEKLYETNIKELKEAFSKIVRAQEVCKLTMDDVESDIQTSAERIALTNSRTGIVAGLRAVLIGLPDKEMFDEATGVINDRYDQSIGSLDNVLDMTKGIISAADMGDVVALQAAMQKLNQVEEPTHPGVTADPPSSAETGYESLLK